MLNFVASEVGCFIAKKIFELKRVKRDLKGLDEILRFFFNEIERFA